MTDQPTSATEDFEAFRARREAARASRHRLTWRRLEDAVGGGWSGLGSRGELVWIGPNYEYGRLYNAERRRAGRAQNLADAQVACFRLLYPGAYRAVPHRGRTGWVVVDGATGATLAKCPNEKDAVARAARFNQHQER